MGGGSISVKATKIDALKLQSSTYGATVPALFGVNRVPGNVLWYGDFTQIKHKKSQRAGKGGPRITTVDYTYTADVAVAIGEGPIIGIPTTWAGKSKYAGGIAAAQILTVAETYAVPTGGGAKTVANASGWRCTVAVSYTATIDVGDGTTTGPVYLAEGTDYTVAAGVYTFGAKWQGKTLSIEYQYLTGSLTQAGLVDLGVTMFAGQVGQATWSVIATTAPAESIPYSGIAYVAGDDYDLGTDATVPNHTFEVQARLAYHLGSTVPDADPAMFMLAMLTDGRYGAMFNAQRLNLSLWSKYCRAAGLLMSPGFTEQIQAGELVDRMARLTNTGAVWSAGQLKMIPYGDSALSGNGATYTPNLTPLYDLDDSHFLPRAKNDPPIFTNPKASADAKNWVRVEFLDRANEYNVAIAEWKDQADIDVNGLRPADIIVAHWIADRAVAVKVAQLEVQRQISIRTEYSFRLPWTFALLEPMDLLTITDSYLGLSKQPVRITEITENPDGDLDVTVEECPAGIATASTYGTQGAGGYTADYNAAPGSVTAPFIFEAPADRTQTGLEVYAAVIGTGANWGGCNVWVSLDGTGYRNIGTVFDGSRYGHLTGAISGGNLPVQLTGNETIEAASAEDALALTSLCYIGGASPEFLAYQGATLTGAGAYTLAGLNRGAYGTDGTAAHATNDPFVIVDESVAKSGPLELSMIGKTLHFKFTSFNQFGNNEQDLADVTDYTYTIDGGNTGVQAPTGLTATETTGGIQFTITPAGGVLSADIVLELYELNAASPYGAASLVWSGINTTFLLSKPGPGTWYYWARARRNTAVSDYYPNGNGVAGTAGSSAGGVLKGAATGGATASGTLSGSTGLAANLNAATYTRYSGSPATLRFSADGYVYAPTTGARVYQWKTGGGVAGDYQIRATVTAGSFSENPSGGSWIDLSADRDFKRSSAFSFSADVTATFEIRMKAAPNTVLDSASIELVCDLT